MFPVRPVACVRQRVAHRDYGYRLPGFQFRQHAGKGRGSGTVLARIGMEGRLQANVVNGIRVRGVILPVPPFAELKWAEFRGRVAGFRINARLRFC